MQSSSDDDDDAKEQNCEIKRAPDPLRVRSLPRRALCR